MGNPGTGGLAASEVAQPLTLTEEQVVGFLDTMDALEKMGNEAAAKTGADPSRPEAFARALETSGAADEILRKNGFASTTEFQRVGYNAALAYSVLEQGGKEAVRKKMEAAKVDQQRAMDKMRQHLSPEQMKMLGGQMGTAMGVAEAMQDVPDENLVLMKKYGPRMAKLRKP